MTKATQLQLIVAAQQIEGESYIKIQNYENSSGEIATHTILVNYDAQEIKKSDIAKLNAFSPTAYSEVSQIPVNVLTQAKKELLESLSKPHTKRSNAQNEAYSYIAPGLKVHKESSQLYVSGLLVEKQIHEKSNKIHETKNSELVIAKNKIKKVAKLQGITFRNYCLGSKETVTLKNITL